MMNHIAILSFVAATLRGSGEQWAGGRATPPLRASPPCAAAGHPSGPNGDGGGQRQRVRRPRWARWRRLLAGAVAGGSRGWGAAPGQFAEQLTSYTSSNAVVYAKRILVSKALHLDAIEVFFDQCRNRLTMALAASLVKLGFVKRQLAGPPASTSPSNSNLFIHVVHTSFDAAAPGNSMPTPATATRTSSAALAACAASSCAAATCGHALLGISTVILLLSAWGPGSARDTRAWSSGCVVGL